MDFHNANLLDVYARIVCIRVYTAVCTCSSVSFFFLAEELHHQTEFRYRRTGNVYNVFTIARRHLRVSYQGERENAAIDTTLYFRLM